jgi:ribosomal protein S18 acetylase RimI-like enzyme
MTPEGARRIERANDASNQARIVGVGSIAGNPVGVESRQLSQRIAATVARRPVWYYGYFSHVYGVGAGADVAEALGWTRAASVAARTYVCPFDADEALLRHLSDAGMRPVGFMQVLYGSPTPDRDGAPSGVELREDVEAFVEHYCSHAPPGFDAPAIVRGEMREWRCYAALVDGRPVAGGAMHVHEGVATLAAAGTLPEYRGRGIQSALLRRRIADAGAAGCDLVVCSASPGSTSQRNQERVGLRPAYTRLTWADDRVPSRP